MKLLGLTGDIACGKSTLAAWLQEQGAAHLDADQMVHELYANADFARRVAALFAGEDILDAHGTVNRAGLSTLVFEDAVALKKLEHLVHPAVAALREEKLRALASQEKPPQVVALEAVKLIESGQARGCNEVWCVVCSPQTQMARLMENRHLSEEEARARLASQPSFAEKQSILARLQIPLICIENDGALPELKASAQRHWNQFIA